MYNLHKVLWPIVSNLPPGHCCPQQNLTVVQDDAAEDKSVTLQQIIKEPGSIILALGSAAGAREGTNTTESGNHQQHWVFKHCSILERSGWKQAVNLWIQDQNISFVLHYSANKYAK